MRGFVGDLIFLFIDGHTVALGLYREWKAYKLEPGQEAMIHEEPRLGIGTVDDAIWWYVVGFFSR